MLVVVKYCRRKFLMVNAQSDNRNMKRLKDEQQVRKRPAPIFGTNDENGAFHSVDEIIANSIDEAREGYGKIISVTVEEGNIVTVDDEGRGLPMDYNEDEQMYNWELALCTLYASGKYDDSQYGQSLGLNGLGLTATQFASSFMDVWSTYGGKTRYIHFEKGRPVGNMRLLDPIKGGTGTKIRFQPDEEVFPALRHKTLTADMFLPLLNSQAMLHAGLKIIFNHYEIGHEVTFLYEGGMAEFIDKVIEDKTLLPNAVEFFDNATGTDDHETNPEKYKVDMKVAFNFCRDHTLVKIYHNGSIMFEGGKTVDGFEAGITKAFTDVARANNKLTRADKFLYKDIESLLICVASTDAPGNRTWFKNQTKGAINNPFIGQAFMEFTYNKVRYWLENNKAFADKVIAEAIISKKAREDGAEVSKKVIRNLSKTVSFTNKPKDFRDCSSKNIFERELYIVEGRSALGSVKLACNPKFQGVMPVRGKPINCLKENVTRALSNDIIIDLYRVFGCGMEVTNKNLQDLPKFDIKKLNWGKLIICTDADVDGMHIRCLIITMMYILSPSLLKSGKVYIAETPLYEMTYKKDTRFAFDENEKDSIMQEFINLGAKEGQVKIQRSKGLGENDPEMMSISTMRPDTRRLIPVEYPENDSELITYFNALLGDDLETRRILIDEYFDLVKESFD
jgi:type IIA topoisomerase (DNA gyrase/topo II, topoisomerase IV), B subunit